MITIAGCSSNESIHTAISGDDEERVLALIADSENVNAVDEKGNTALHLALSQSQLGLVEPLLENGADVNAFEGFESPFHYAIRWGYEDLSQLFIKHGADVNKANQEGDSPLILAVGENVEITRILLENGADVDVTSQGVSYFEGERESPIARALHEYNYNFSLTDDAVTQVVRLLIEHGADVGVPDSSGRTALHVAAGLADSYDSMELLIESGANVNAKDHDGETPLHVAVTVGITNTRLLIDHGADVKATSEPRHYDNTDVFYDASFDTSPRTPLDNAVANHNIQTGPNEWSPLSDGELIEIIRLLIENGA